MGALRLSRLVACAAMALAGGAARAATPDLSGMWQFDFSSWIRGEVVKTVPLTPAAAVAVQKRRDAIKRTDHVREVANMKCLPTGFPQLMQWRSPIEILQAFGRVTIITEHDPGNDEPRTIYLNLKAHPKILDQTWNGHSIGHWEGDVLVVDTIGFNDRATLVAGLPRTPTTHVTERFRLTNGGKTLLDEMTFEDPASFTRPWTLTFKFQRQPDDMERLEAVCEPDIDALAALDLQAIKDADIEAARMLDPDLKYNPLGK